MGRTPAGGIDVASPDWCAEVKDLTKYSIPELLDQFRNERLARRDTYLTEDVSKRNKLFDFLLAVTRELKRRGVEERAIAADFVGRQ